MNIELNENLRNSCQQALETLKKLKRDETTELQSKLEWCLGSYDYDKNPSGLYEYGVVALETMKSIKADNPRKINKKVIEGLQVGLQNYESSKN
jgi:hypothetical protein